MPVSPRTRRMRREARRDVFSGGPSSRRISVPGESAVSGVGDSKNVSSVEIIQRDCAQLPSAEVGFRLDAEVDIVASETSSDEEYLEDYIDFADESEENPAGSLVKDLRGWAHGVPAVKISALLSILKPHHPELPLSARTLLQTPRKSQSVVMGSGKFVYFGLGPLKTFIDCPAEPVALILNMDGLPLFKSPPTVFWTIQGKVAGMTADPHIIGIFYGSCKPDASVF